MRSTFLACLLALSGAVPVAAQDPPPVTPAAAAESAAPDRPVRFVFTDMWRDAKRLGSTSNLITVGVGGGAAWAIHPHEVSLGARAMQSDELNELFEGGGVSGGGWAQVGTAVGTYALGQAFNNPRIRIVGVDLMQAQFLNSLMTGVVKVAAHRTRPDGGRFSFPSGHTSGSFATATVLARHFGWKVGIPAYVAASYVAASRVQDNRHYISDVIFGAAMGVVAGRTMARP